jgi:hypothetical protein
MFIATLFTIAKLWKQPGALQLMSGSRKCIYIYIMVFSSAIRNNNMWSEGKWMQLEDIMVSEVSQAQKERLHVFSHTWQIDPKDKHIHKNKHDCI